VATFPRTPPAAARHTSAPSERDLSGRKRDQLYDEFQPLVRRLIAQYGGDPELREELPGEIYCRFSQLLEAYDPTRGIPMEAYLVRTLPTAVYSYARRRWRQRQRESRLDPEGAWDDGTGTGAASEDPTHQWDDQLLLKDTLAALPGAIAGLPLRQRQVVIWRYYEGRSFEEIAEALSIQPATARSLLRHGVNHLRRSIGGTGSW